MEEVSLTQSDSVLEEARSLVAQLLDATFCHFEYTYVAGCVSHLRHEWEYHKDAMGWMIRWLGETPPGRITPQHVVPAYLAIGRYSHAFGQLPRLEIRSDHHRMS
jgi:hypothetical protein